MGSVAFGAVRVSDDREATTFGLVGQALCDTRGTVHRLYKVGPLRMCTVLCSMTSGRCGSDPCGSASLCFPPTGRKDPPCLPCPNGPMYLGACLSFSGPGLLPCSSLTAERDRILFPGPPAAREMAPNQSAAGLLTLSQVATWRSQVWDGPLMG